MDALNQPANQNDIQPTLKMSVLDSGLSIPAPASRTSETCNESLHLVTSRLEAERQIGSQENHLTEPDELHPTPQQDRRPQVVIIDSSSNEPDANRVSAMPTSPSPSSVSSAGSSTKTIEQNQTDEANDLGFQETEEWVDPGAWVSIQKFGSSQNPDSQRPTRSYTVAPFSIDPFAVGDLDSHAVPEMPTIPVLSKINRAEYEKLKLDGNGWTVAKADDRPDQAIDGSNEADEQNVFYAEPSEVLFIDGSLGFDHIDLRCFDVSQATFQNNTIIVTLADSEPITIRFRGIDYAVFSGEVMVDL